MTNENTPPEGGARKDGGPRNFILLIGGIVLAIVVLGWLGGRSATPSPGGGTTTGVQWADYTAGLQGRIDSLAASKDCDALQDEFDNADANNAATMSRTGHNNAKLMAYIDGKMDGAGCYGD
jgi:hypothetical protein